MIYKKIITKVLFLGLIVSFATLQPAYSEKWEGFTWSNIKKALNYVGEIPEKLDKLIEEANKELTKRYNESDIDEYMDEFANLMGPVSTSAAELNKLPPNITRTTTKAVTSKITKNLLAWTDPVASGAQFLGASVEGDKVGAVEAAYNAVLSGEYAAACGAVGGCLFGPPGVVGGIVIGGITYPILIESGIVTPVADYTSNFLQESQELENKKTRRLRVDQIKKNRDLNIKRCTKWQKEYIDGGDRPPRAVYSMCKKYKIDIYNRCPHNPNKKEPGVCGCTKPDTDVDGDGVYDCNDGCKDNPKLTKKGKYGKDGCQTEDDWRREQIEASGLKCTKYQFIQWNENKNIPECICQGGMVWSEEEQECISEQDANTKPFKSCKERGGVSKFQEGKYIYLFCEAPLKWNLEGTKCVDAALAKIDCSRWKGSIPGYRNKKPGCICASPLVINKAKNACITEEEDSPARTVNAWLPGSKATYDNYEKPVCTCILPMVLNQKKNACISQEEMEDEEMDDDSWIGKWSVYGTIVQKGKNKDIRGILEITDTNKGLILRWNTVKKSRKKSVMKLFIVIEDGIIRANEKMLFQKKLNTKKSSSKDVLGLKKSVSMLEKMILSLRISKNKNICTIRVKQKNKNSSFNLNCKRL